MNKVRSEWLDLVRKKVESLRFGVVQITVHDSKVTQIDRTDKTRLESSRSTFDLPDQLEES